MSSHKVTLVGLLAALLVACGDAHDAERALEMTADAGTLPGVELVSDSGASPAANDAAVTAAGDAASQPAAAQPDAGVVEHADARTEPAPCAARFYRDGDSDGFGDPGSFVVSCTRPNGYTADNSDCYDGSRDAHPGQTSWFWQDRGDGSFDYNCDGVSKPEYGLVATVPDLSTWHCPPIDKEIDGVPCDYNAQLQPWRIALDAWYMSVPGCGATAVTGPGCGIAWHADSKTYSCEAPDPASMARPDTSRQFCN